MTDENRMRYNWQHIALGTSIALNLFFAALIAGYLLNNRTVADASGMPLARALARAEASLSTQDASAFAAAIKRGEPHYANDAHQLAESREALERQIVAEPFDPAKTRQAVVVWQTAWDKFLMHFSDTLVVALAKVSPEGRQKLASGRRSVRMPLAGK